MAACSSSGKLLPATRGQADLARDPDAELGAISRCCSQTFATCPGCNLPGPSCGMRGLLWLGGDGDLQQHDTLCRPTARGLKAVLMKSRAGSKHAMEGTCIRAHAENGCQDQAALDRNCLSLKGPTCFAQADDWVVTSFRQQP